MNAFVLKSLRRIKIIHHRAISKPDCLLTTQTPISILPSLTLPRNLLPIFTPFYTKLLLLFKQPFSFQTTILFSNNHSLFNPPRAHIARSSTTNHGRLPECLAILPLCNTVKFRNKAQGLIFFNIFWVLIFGGLIFGGAYLRREISVSKSAGLIIGEKFVSAIFQCANDNIGALTRNS